MSGKLRAKLERKAGRPVSSDRRRSGVFGSLLDRVEQKRRASEPAIGYDGENFTRNGQRTTRDSLRMG